MMAMTSKLSSWCALGIALFLGGVMLYGVPAWSQAAVPAPALSVVDGLRADTATDPEAMQEYEVAVRQLLNDGNFSELDRVANLDRTNKLKFAGGVWKLYVLHQGLKTPAEGTYAPDEAWDKHLSALTTWADANKESVTARVALAEALTNYVAKLQNAAKNRREDRAQKGPDALARIRQVQHLRDLVLKEASKLNTKCPHYYFVKLEIEERRDRESGDEQFEEAIAFEPTYFPYYRLHAVFQRTEWDGDRGQAEKFADEISKRVGGKQGAALYFEIAAALTCSPSVRHFQKAELSWDRIRDGYAALEELYGHSVYKTNQYAYLAVRYDKTAVASEILKRLGDAGDEYTWGSRTLFGYMRDWAVAPSDIADLRAKTVAEEATATGLAFQKRIHDDVGRQFISVIRQCSGRPVENDPVMGWDLFFRLGTNGEIEEVKSWPQTPFTQCAVPNFKGSLSAPPHGEYWVKISSQPYILKF
jgi:hypothetical protein